MQRFAQRRRIAAYVGQTALVAREALIQLAHGALGIGHLLLRILECREPRVEVALPA